MTEDKLETLEQLNAGAKYNARVSVQDLRELIAEVRRCWKEVERQRQQERNRDWWLDNR